MKPTYEQLETKLAEAEAELALTKQKLEDTQFLLQKALDRITLLEERLNQNSQNSSKPPSSDQKSNRSGGGKTRSPRKEGFSRAPFSPDQVDRFMMTTLESCPCCGSQDLHDLDDPLVLQQVEIPEVKAVPPPIDGTQIWGQKGLVSLGCIRQLPAHPRL